MGNYNLLPEIKLISRNPQEFWGNNNFLDLQKICRDWEHAGYLWNMGYYTEFCTLSKNCLDKIYSSQKVDDSEQIPPFLSFRWGFAIGHMGSLGAFLTAQDLGIVSEIKRSLPVCSREQALQIHVFFQDKVTPFKSAHSFSILENPSQWHFSERLMMIKVPGDFISLYELHERVYSSVITQNREPFIRIDPEYEMKARENLSRLGLPKDSWFVGFHIRENPDPLDPRCASLESFLPSIRQIGAHGGWVIRFGTGSMKHLVGVKNVLDLNLDIPDNRYLHPYILAKSKFLLTTNSGPSVMAWALGTPVLQTNTLSIGRNILTASKGSLYLPIIWIQKGEKCSYDRLVNSLEGYNETNLKEKEITGFRHRENTKDEIWEATRDMLRSLNDSVEVSENNKKLSSIRLTQNAVGYGEIAPSFLSKHENWFLN